MKKMFALALVAAVAFSPAFSQEQKPQEKTTDQKAQVQKDVQKDVQKADPAQKAKEWENKIKTELNLTPEQVEKFNALAKEFGAKKDEIAKDQSLNDDQRKEKKQALMKEKEAKFLEILTPEQVEKYKAIRAEMEKKEKEQQPIKQ